MATATLTSDVPTSEFISPKNSMLPPLCLLAYRFSAEAISQIDNAFLPHPGTELRTVLMKLAERIIAIVPALYFAENHKDSSATRERILDGTNLLMHELSSTAEFLGKLLYAVIPYVGKKNKVADKAIHAMEKEVNRLFKIPVNKIKHEQFRLAWITARNGDTLVQGFYLNGLVGANIKGPASHRYGEAAIAEVYSFNLILRKAVEVFFKICEIAENAISRHCELSQGAEPPGIATTQLEAKIEEALALLQSLSTSGFPGEALPINSFSTRGGRIVRTGAAHLTPIRVPPQEVQVEFGGLVGGDKVKFPSWVVSRHGCKITFPIERQQER